ncbi:endoribonuclease L-PSP [Nitratireductor indicus C115]|uniref:Endoribonuclease L-PSP n=1 Tax=Nitratireductor indicus C115 TaxID=1231190 RepID=K2NZ05_9HYPH|nr:Rid family hydrolase [Nitratireductor indicus]EKF43074.1 endoribonuclease L-PSP [Nitratireductor indicus C115]SFQ52594.1 Enamine deaminase RidA, house cleaning of reactive enamine intermediates, YjgF/YER057c/UK114 family [Nitratireductor indicus]
MKNRIFAGVPSEDIAGYARAVVDGSTIHVSGVTGRDPVSGDFPEQADEQARNCLAAIDTSLRQAGASLENAVVCRVYVVDQASAAAVTPVLGEIFADIRPTNTMLICQIPAAGAKVEIEITASTAA